MWAPVVVIGAGLLMMLVEWRQPGRVLPEVSGWWARAVVANVLQLGVVAIATLTWDRAFAESRLLNADDLGPFGGALVGYLVITFVYYFWHRARHRIPLLWRLFHQLHHSPQRIQIITSFYKHPAELLVNGLLSSVILYFLVGLGPVAATYAVMLTGLAELFYHWNVRTPRWLGYLIQRPEMHCVHHQEGLHHFNYGDLPLWDLVFGTFRNPSRFEGRCGFGDHEHRLVDMLRGRDLTPELPPLGGAGPRTE